MACFVTDNNSLEVMSIGSVEIPVFRQEKTVIKRLGGRTLVALASGSDDFFMIESSQALRDAMASGSSAQLKLTQGKLEKEFQGENQNLIVT